MKVCGAGSAGLGLEMMCRDQGIGRLQDAALMLCVRNSTFANHVRCLFVFCVSCVEESRGRIPFGDISELIVPNVACRKESRTVLNKLYAHHKHDTLSAQSSKQS